MKLILKIAVAFVLVLGVSSCGILGIHFKVKNPKRAGKYPKFKQEAILLGEMNQYRSVFDVTFYDIDIKVMPDDKMLSGVVEIHATATADFDSLQIDLDNQFDIHSIRMGGSTDELHYAREERAVFVKMPREMQQGTAFSLSVSYSGKPHKAKKPPWKGGFVWEKDKNKKPWIGVACESDGSSLWWPLKDHTGDEPDSVAMHITCPSEVMGVSNGRFRGKTAAPEANWSTYHWFTSYPINTYNITLYVGDFKLLHDSFKNEGRMLDLDHYVLSYNFEKAKVHFRQLHDQLRYFEQVFGEYPWYEDGFKLVESPYAGMEHQSAIAYGQGYKNGPMQDFDYIILHESAHEWWGNSVSAFDLADVWIHEGFATYAEALYVEHTQGKSAYLNYLLFQRWMIKNKRPVVGPLGRRYFDYKDSDAYVKGSWVLHTLRSEIDDDTLFFDIIKTFAARYREKVITSQEFIDLVNEKTGTDYSWFFKQFLNDRRAPILEYNVAKDGNFYYRWSDTNQDTDFQMSVKVVGNDKVVTIQPTFQVQQMPNPFGAVDELTFNNRYKYFGIKENKRLKMSPAADPNF